MSSSRVDVGWVTHDVKSAQWSPYAHNRILYSTYLVFCVQNCAELPWQKECVSDREKLLKFEAGGQEFAKFLKLLEQFIRSVKDHTNL